MREQELCEAVLKRAYESERWPGLLEVLGEFEEVRRGKGVDRHAEEAVQAYRRLMRWGREGKRDWWGCYKAEFGLEEKGIDRSQALSSISVQSQPVSDLIRALVSPTNSHLRQTSALSPERPRFRMDRDFSPTKDSVLPQFAFVLPQFPPFLRKMQKTGDADSTSALYRVRER